MCVSQKKRHICFCFKGIKRPKFGVFDFPPRPPCCAAWSGSRGVTSLLRARAQTVCCHMKARRPTASHLLLSKETCRWRTWQLKNHWSCIFSCRWRASPADTTRQTPPSPSSVETPSSAENTANTTSEFFNFITDIFQGQSIPSPLLFLYKNPSKMCQNNQFLLINMLPNTGTSTVTSRWVWTAGLSRDAHWRIWAAPTARGGFSPQHKTPPSPTSETNEEEEMKEMENE